jgi:hypothetical protein
LRDAGTANLLSALDRWKPLDIGAHWRATRAHLNPSKPDSTRTSRPLRGGLSHEQAQEAGPCSRLDAPGRHGGWQHFADLLFLWTRAASLEFPFRRCLPPLVRRTNRRGEGGMTCGT